MPRPAAGSEIITGRRGRVISAPLGTIIYPEGLSRKDRCTLESRMKYYLRFHLVHTFSFHSSVFIENGPTYSNSKLRFVTTVSSPDINMSYQTSSLGVCHRGSTFAPYDACFRKPYVTGSAEQREQHFKVPADSADVDRSGNDIRPGYDI